jgi:hypothetical protein
MFLPLLAQLSSGSFTPKMISGLRLWIDSNDLSSITKDGSNLVSQINDKSGNGFNLTATLTQRPTWTASQYGALPALVFNGTTNTMVLPSSITSLNSLSFFIVTKNTTGATESRFAQGVTGNFAPLANRTNKYAIFDGAHKLFNTTTLATNSCLDTRLDSAGNSAELWVNGVKDSTVNTFTANNLSGGFVGAGNAGTSFYLAGNIAEILVYNLLTLSQQAQVRAYLKAKWGL